MSEAWKDLTHQTKKLASRVEDGLKVTGDALHNVKKAAVKRQPAITSTVEDALKATGSFVRTSGANMAARAKESARRLDTVSEQDRVIDRSLLHLEKYATTLIGTAGKLAMGLGSSTEKAAPILGATAGGAILGLTETASNLADSAAITDNRFERVQLRIRAASPPVRAEIDRRSALIRRAHEAKNKTALADALIVGGVSVATILANPAETPANVEHAFSLAYPGLVASGETFADVAARLTADGLVGLVNGVKGKLFEVELVDHLNSSTLGNGEHARLVESVTQTGHDIEIVDENGQILELVQAKATESVAYVLDALERYPGIDISTTTEVYAQLMARAPSEYVTDSGISEHVLEQKVEAALSAGDFTASDLVPSTLGLALIGLSAFMNGKLSLEERGAEFGDRAAKASFAGTAAAVALVASNTWWLALAAGLGSRSLITYGGNKRERYENLENVAQILEAHAAASPHRLQYRPA